MNTRTVTSRRPAGGFTLIEAMAVIVILAILAATAIPGVRSIDAQRFAVAAEQVRGALRVARAQADAVSLPVGVRIDRNAGSLALVTYDPDAGEVVPADDPMGEPSATRYLRSIDPSVTITGLVNGDGSDDKDQQTIWFRYDGRPHTRDGATGADFTEDALIDLASGAETERVRVRRFTGAIE